MIRTRQEHRLLTLVGVREIPWGDDAVWEKPYHAFAADALPEDPAGQEKLKQAIAKFAAHPAKSIEVNLSDFRQIAPFNPHMRPR